MSYTDRVVAYVTRERDGRRELLVFDHRDHPHAGTQVPAGRLEAGEDVEQGLVRELHEEAGLDDVRIVRKLGEFDGDELNHGRGLRNDACGLAPAPARDVWDHAGVGDGRVEGLVFVYRWEPLATELELWGDRDPVVSRLF